MNNTRRKNRIHCAGRAEGSARSHVAEHAARITPWVTMLLLGACAPWYQRYGLQTEAQLQLAASFPILLRAAYDGKCEAATHLAALGTVQREESVKALISLLGRCGSFNRFYIAAPSSAAAGLAFLASAAHQTSLIKMAASQENSVAARLDALVALGLMGQRAVGSLPMILILLSDPNPDVRARTMRTVIEIAPRSPLTVKGLLTLLKDDDGLVRADAAAVLPRALDASPEVIDALEQALNDKDIRVHDAALEAKRRVIYLAAIGKADTQRLAGANAAQAVAAPAPLVPQPAAPVSASGPALGAEGVRPPAEVALDFVSGAPQRNAYALIVGVESYRDVPRATAAREDARRFASLAKVTLGVPEEHIKLVLDERATRGDIDKGIAWVRKNVPEGGRIYFFFSGHGAPNPSTGASYLLPFDGDARQLDQSALAINAVLRSLAASKAREILVLIDACFSGAGGRSVLPPGIRPLVRVQATAPAPRIALLTAATGAEVSGSAPVGGGLFSRTLFAALGQGAADQDGDGSVSLQELFDWVRPRVARMAQQESRPQTPSLVIGARFGRPRDFMVASGLSSR